MFDVRLRLATDAGQPSRVLPTITASVTGYSSPQLRFTVSEKVAGQIDAPFLVIVEYSIGGAYVRPRNDLFIVDEDSADSVDANGATTFTASNAFSWLSARMPLWWRPGDTAELQRGYTAATPGHVLTDLITKSQNISGAEGWAPYVTLGFTAARDSANVLWADRITQSWPLFTTTIARALDTLITQGYVEIWTEGFAVKAVAAGTGSDLSSTVVLGGPGVTSAPAKRVFDPATGIVVQHDKGWSYLNNPGADSRFGTVVKVMSQSGAPDVTAATKNAQPALTEARAIQEELSYEWTVIDGLPRPWVDFQVGDVVTARTRRGTKLLRVIGLDVSKDAKGEVKARAVVGSKILDLEAKVAKRTSATSTGTLIGGNGSTPPPVVGSPSAAPLPPQGLHVETNVGSWRADGTAVADVKLEWLAVTQAVEGSSVDVEVYEVWARRASETPSLAFQTSSLSVTTDAWAPGVTQYVSVRARSRAGVWSAFSPEIAVTPQVPGVIIPKAPTGLAVASNTAAFQTDGSALATVTMTWTAVTQSLDNLPVTIQEYELRVGQDTQRVTSPTATFTVPTGSSSTVSVRALTTLGLWGDPSLTISVTGAAPTSTMPTPSTPILTAGMGGVGFRWDGLSSTGVAMPAGFGRVTVDTAPAASGPWTTFGATLSAAGGGGVTAPIGTAVFVRFRSFDTLGRIGGTSAVTSATAVGVALGDIAPDLSGALGAIRTTADGKNRIYPAITVPGVGIESWRNRHTNPDLLTGTAGWGHFGGAAAFTVVRSVLPVGEVNLPRPGAAATFTASAEGIGSANLGDAVSVTAGETITASFYIRRGGTVWDARATPRIDWSNGTRAFGAVVTIVNGTYARLTVTATVPEGVTTARLNVLFPSMPAGSVFRVRMAQIETGPVATDYRDGTSPAVPGKGYRWEGTVGASASIELTSAFAPGDQWWQLDPSGSSIVGVKVWNGVDWIGYLLVADQIIAAESITAPLIKTGEIQVNHVSPSFGSDLMISANSSVTILVGRQDEQASSLSSLEDGVEVAQSTATSAASTAGTAQSSATAAKVAADTAAAVAADVGERLDRHQTYYRFGTSGLAIGDPNTNAELRLEPDGIRMTQNNVIVSEWVGGVLVASEVRLQSAVIANHQWLPYGAGRTIVRPV